jgi:hypothetical protein
MGWPAANLGILHKSALDAHFLAELIEDDGNAIAMPLGQDVLDQAGLSRPQVTCATSSFGREEVADSREHRRTCL